MTDPITDVNGRRLILGKTLPHDDPRAPLQGVFVAYGDDYRNGRPLLLELTPTAALELALQLYRTVSGHESTDPYGLLADPLRELSAEEAERMDEELGHSPSPWEPNAGERARAIELYEVRMGGTPQSWERALLDYSRDINRDMNTPAAINAAVTYGVRRLIEQARDANVIRARIAHDLAVAREIALADKEAEQ